MVEGEYPVTFKEVLEAEKTYYDGTKNALYNSIEELNKDKPSIGDLVYAQSLINVYLAIKHAEAKGKVEWTDEKDNAIHQSLIDWHSAISK